VILETSDSPQVPIGEFNHTGPNSNVPGILPSAGIDEENLNSTDLNFSMFFELYAVWQFDDQVIYTLGLVTWEVQFQGTITGGEFGSYDVNFTPGSLNNVHGNDDFTPFNGDTRPVLPIANNEFDDWK